MNTWVVKRLRLMFVVCLVFAGIVLSEIRRDAAAVHRWVEPLGHPERSEGSIWKVWRGGGCGASDQEGR